MRGEHFVGSILRGVTAMVEGSPPLVVVVAVVVVVAPQVEVY